MILSCPRPSTALVLAVRGLVNGFVQRCAAYASAQRWTRYGR